MTQEYVDGFLLAIPEENLDRYREMAGKAGLIWKKHGALDYRECVVDDAESEGYAKFRKACGAREGETVVFAWIVYPDKTTRNRVNEAVMSDPALKDACPGDIFDMARMVWGGFNTLVVA